MKMLRIFVFLIIIANTSLLAQTESLSPKFKALIDTSRTKALLRQCSRSVPANAQEFWQLRSADVQALEKNLLKLCKTINNNGNDCNKNFLSNYAYQYGGIMMNGKKYIYINALVLPRSGDPDAEYKDWQTIPLTICNGGKNFWGVVYDLENNSFSDLSYNNAD